MRFSHAGLLCAVLTAPVAIPQNTPDQNRPDKDTRAREYIQFLVQELDQWTHDFPQAYNMALVRPPVDASSLPEAARSGAVNLRDTVTRLTALSGARDLTANTDFRAQIERTLTVAAPVNLALSKQRFPEAVETDWGAIRTGLNSLAEIYKVTQLPVLEVPAAANDKSEKKAVVTLPAGAIAAYVVDQSCAARGKGMWVNAQCVQKCVRDGDKVVLVTEQGKVIQIVNPDKIEAESYGQKVAVTGKADGDSITIATIQIL